jgi:tRNA(fMet)-specific endonuclease VapC
MVKYLLDTNIVIYTLKSRPQQVRRYFKEKQGLVIENWVED